MLKIFAQRLIYFTDYWNIFDFSLVVVTLIILAISLTDMAQNLKILGTFLLILRTMRLVRIIKKH